MGDAWDRPPAEDEFSLILSGAARFIGGRLVPCRVIEFREEHPWPVRVLYWLLGVSHCGKRGWR